MNFSEKLQILRRSRGYTQEKLAEELNVSRQAVVKWETGTSCPGIANLLQLSDLMHVTVDYLIREQECGAIPGRNDSDDIGDMIDFRIRAARNTYAGCMNETASSRFDSHDFFYEEAPWAYVDTYVGGEQFAGEEAVWKNGRAVYAMNYCGRVLHGNFSGNFLKEALRAASRETPFRGPEYYRAGEYTYKCKVNGDMRWFQGYEEICCHGDVVYECYFHGGLIR